MNIEKEVMSRQEIEKENAEYLNRINELIKVLVGALNLDGVEDDWLKLVYHLGTSIEGYSRLVDLNAPEYLLDIQLHTVLKRLVMNLEKIIF